MTVRSPSPLPSAALPAATWAAAHDRLVADLRDLVRVPSVNPPTADRPDGELLAARLLADRLAAAGLEPEVVEPVPGRGSVHARLRGDGTGGEPLLLLSHLDVVPARADRWTHDPFAAEIHGGYIYGRGTVDMKGTAAMELGVMCQLAAEARAAGLDPARDPVPGLRRDLLFTSTADEEAGGTDGAKWIVDHRPEWVQAAAAINESGGVSVTVRGHRLYPILVAEKGYAAYRITVSGTAGHGSVPRDDNAAVLAARVVERLAVPGPTRLTPVMVRFLESAADALGGEAGVGLRRVAAGGDDVDAILDAVCEPRYARTLRALVRDTLSPDVIQAGVRYNVIPGDAVIELDCRVLPGTTEPAMRADVERRIGDLGQACSIELMVWGEPVEAPADGPFYEILTSTLRDHDPDGIPLPAMATFATDMKQLAPLGVPGYGFSPYRMEPDEFFLDGFHSDDERLSVDALRFGLPVLYDVVRRFCG